MSILQPQLLLIKVGIIIVRRTTTIGADDIFQRFPDCNVLTANLVILSPERAVIRPFVLGLRMFLFNQNKPTNMKQQGETQQQNKRTTKPLEENKSTFIWVLLFWNQNLICLGAKPSSLLNCSLCFSSG